MTKNTDNSIDSLCFSFFEYYDTRGGGGVNIPFMFYSQASQFEIKVLKNMHGICLFKVA